ncbi:MAG: hypothetical protein IKX14_04605, partial [Neisseriaceae bacterium]|nr:hypothetical protein [Neisseriaceae bacterium]
VPPDIVGKFQNNNALVRLAVLVYTVCGSPPFILLNFTDDNRRFFCFRLSFAKVSGCLKNLKKRR